MKRVKKGKNQQKLLKGEKVLKKTCHVNGKATPVSEGLPDAEEWPKIFAKGRIHIKCSKVLNYSTD